MTGKAKGRTGQGEEMKTLRTLAVALVLICTATVVAYLVSGIVIFTRIK